MKKHIILNYNEISSHLNLHPWTTPILIKTNMHITLKALIKNGSIPITDGLQTIQVFHQVIIFSE